MPVIRAQFTKLAPVRYISHLDLMRTLERAMRRAQVPVALSEGYHPRPMFSLASALAVGVTSEAEYGDFRLTENWTAEKFCRKVNQELPFGIRILQAKHISESARSLMSVVDRATYVCTPIAVRTSDETNPLPDGLEEILRHNCERLMLAREISIERVRKDKTKRVDIRPLLYGMQVDSHAGLHVILDVASGSHGNVRPAEVLRLLSDQQLVWQIHRTGLYVTQEGTRISPMEVEV